MINFDKCWDTVINDPNLRKSTIHGSSYWARAGQNGFFIGTKVDTDITVIKLFALFHDSGRSNDGINSSSAAKIVKFSNDSGLHARKISTVLQI